MQPTSKKQTAKSPVSAHPAFPVIVALWFCALFGIGSMVLPAALLEKVVTSTGISSVVPAAAPPLGMTARILIALAAAGVGVVAGLFIARKVSASQGSSTPAPDRSIAAVVKTGTDSATDRLSTKKPISAHEELGSDWFDAPFDDEVTSVEGDGHRFHAALESGEVLSGERPDPAAPPAGSDATGEVANLDDDALELAAFAENGDQPAFIEDAPLHNHHSAHDDDDDDGAEPAADHAADHYGIPLVAPQAPPPYAPLAESDEESAPLASEDEAMADHTQTTPSAATDAQTDTQDVPASARTKEAPAAHRIDNILNRPLAELSIAGLVERFAHALETHRASVAEQAKTAPAPQHSAPTPDSAHATHRSTAHQESAPAAPPPPYVPSALRPIAIDGDDEGYGDENGEIVSDLDLTSALARPTYSAGHTANRSASDQAAEPVPFAIARDTFVEPTGGADSYYEDCERDDEYSSLLTMKSPFNLPRETVRVYDEDDSEDSGSGSTVVFPGQNDRRGRPAGDDMAYPAGGADAVPPHSEIAPATAARRRDVAETEQRLREALEKLQRMSGAA